LAESFCIQIKVKKMKIEKSSNIAKRPVEVEGAKDAEIRWLISKEDGAENFTMRMFEIKPGGFTPLHKHRHEHEIFVVEGEGVLVYEGKEYQFSRDYVIFVPPNKEHRFKNRGDSILRLLCLIPASAV
jgi:quercetin dioxygenase-like cupin family protein